MRSSAFGGVWRRLFSDHPRSIDESYRQHFLAACGIGFRIIAVGVACLCHAVVPAVFEDVASEEVSKLAGEMAQRRAARR